MLFIRAGWEIQRTSVNDAHSVICAVAYKHVCRGTTECDRTSRHGRGPPAKSCSRKSLFFSFHKSAPHTIIDLPKKKLVDKTNEKCSKCFNRENWRCLPCLREQWSELYTRAVRGRAMTSRATRQLASALASPRSLPSMYFPSPRRPTQGQLSFAVISIFFQNYGQFKTKFRC